MKAKMMFILVFLILFLPIVNAEIVSYSFADLGKVISMSDATNMQSQTIVVSIPNNIMINSLDVDVKLYAGKLTYFNAYWDDNILTLSGGGKDGGADNAVFDNSGFDINIPLEYLKPGDHRLYFTVNPGSLPYNSGSSITVLGTSKISVSKNGNGNININVIPKPTPVPTPEPTVDKSNLQRIQNIPNTVSSDTSSKSTDDMNLIQIIFAIGFVILFLIYIFGPKSDKISPIKPLNRNLPQIRQTKTRTVIVIGDHPDRRKCCPRCRGKGRIRCRSCGGSGRDNSPLSFHFGDPCIRCGGTGEERCDYPNCDGGWIYR
jgi:hypothetical protein